MAPPPMQPRDSLPSSFAPSPLPLSQTDTNDIELQLINDEGNLPSVPSSTSPPQAPAPIIMTEETILDQYVLGRGVSASKIPLLTIYMSTDSLKAVEKEIFTRVGSRFFDEVPKQKDQRLLHLKVGLLSMSLHDRSTKFIITLAPMSCLDDDYVVFGEVTRGMHLLNAVNRKGIRNNSRGNVANLGKQVAAVGAFQNDILMGDVQTDSADDTIVNLQVCGAGTGENETEVYDDIYHNEMSNRGTPIDTIVIYACGEKD
ncbi:unnamed protein product [Rotaria magnacalcarata]